MPEHLTKEVVLDCIKLALLNWPRTIGNDSDMVSMYFTPLRSCSPDAVRHAFRAAIESDQYFPLVKRVKELAMEYDRLHRPPVVEKPELWCDRCHRLTDWETRWRPVHDARNRPILTDDNRYMLIEPYQRMLCKCAEKSPFAPAEGVEVDPAWLTARGLQGANEVGAFAVMLLSEAPPLVQKRAAGLL
jgi:hypothetical protein